MVSSTAGQPRDPALDENVHQDHWTYASSRVSVVALTLLALVALGLMLVPWNLWSYSATSAVYAGFDRNLVSTDPSGGGSGSGEILVASSSIEMLAVPGSRPTVHLLSSDADYNITSDLLVLKNDSGTNNPLTMMIWSPRERTAYSLEFGPPPSDEISARLVVDGNDTGAKVLGTYSPGVPYHLDLALDRNAKLVSISLRSTEAPPAATSLSVVGGPSEPGYSELASDYATVKSGRQYAFGGTVRLVQGTDSYKVVLDWFDTNKRKIGSANDWRPVNELNGWTARTFLGTAPAGAAYARMILGSGNGRTHMLMTDLFIHESASPATNLLANGDFHSGLLGWQPLGVSGPQPNVGVVKLAIEPIHAAVGGGAAPALFYRLPVALTLLAASDAGISNIKLENYRLSIPRQAGSVHRVNDTAATLAVVLVSLAGALLFMVWSISVVRHAALESGGRSTARMASRLFSAGVGLRVPLGLVILAAGFVALNAITFGLGSGTFDMAGQKTWAYIGAYKGAAELYFLPNTVTPAELWGGIPYAGLSFPYGPIMAWYFTAVGWADRLFLVGSSAPNIHDFGLEFLLKVSNVLFWMIDGLLIYQILRKSGAREVTSRIAAALFLLNPACWFLMSVWGETQTVTLLFPLLAIWAAQRDRVTLAWIFVAIGALSRPQLIVPSFVMGLLLLTAFRPSATVRAVSWTVVVLALVMVPLFVAVGPSLPANYLLNLVHPQAASDPHAIQYNYVSYDGYSIWPLVSGLVSGQVGKSRIYYPESSHLVGGLSYRDAAIALVVVALALTALWALVMSRMIRWDGRFIPLLGFAMLALLMFDTEVSAQHFVIALAFLIMSINVIPGRFYYPLVLALTVTTFVSLYGSLGYGLSAAPTLATILYPSSNSITRFFMDQFASDRFITIGVCANLLVLTAMGAACVFSSQRSRSLLASRYEPAPSA